MSETQSDSALLLHAATFAADSWLMIRRTRVLLRHE